MAPSCHSTVKYDYETHQSPARIRRRSKARDLAGLSAACGRAFGNTSQHVAIPERRRRQRAAST